MPTHHFAGRFHQTGPSLGRRRIDLGLRTRAHTTSPLFLIPLRTLHLCTEYCAYLLAATFHLVESLHSSAASYVTHPRRSRVFPASANPPFHSLLINLDSCPGSPDVAGEAFVQFHLLHCNFSHRPLNNSPTLFG